MSRGCLLFGGGRVKTPAAPVTVTEQKPIIKGVYYFPGWATPRPEHGLVTGRECPTATPWDDIIRAGDREPALGYYDERRPVIMQAQIEQMERAFDFAIYQVGWSHEHAVMEKAPSWVKPLPEECVPLYGHVAKYHAALPEGATKLKFCLSYFDVMSGPDAESYEYWNTRIKRDGWTMDDLFISFQRFNDVIRSLMLSPHYYRVNGRPVLFLGYPQNLARLAAKFSLTTSDLLTWIYYTLRSSAYLVATGIEDGLHDQLAGMSFDAHTEYNYRVGGYPALRTEYKRRWTENVNHAGLDYWPPVSAGFDGRPWGITEGIAVPTTDEFREHVQEAATFTREHYDKTQGHEIFYSWNERGEQRRVIEPMADTGDEMLRAVSG